MSSKNDDGATTSGPSGLGADGTQQVTTNRAAPPAGSGATGSAVTQTVSNVVDAWHPYQHRRESGCNLNPHLWNDPAHRAQVDLARQVARLRAEIVALRSVDPAPAVMLRRKAAARAVAIAIDAGADWIDQYSSPLGKRKHLRLCREGVLACRQDGKQRLVRRADLDAYLTRTTKPRAAANEDGDALDRDLADLGLLGSAK